MRRVEKHPILDNPEPPAGIISFTFEGKTLEGFAGEPIAAALAAAGVIDLHYSHKQNKPRGIFCGIGQCQECVMIVNGIPNVRTCVTPLKEGMVIRRQHGRGHLPSGKGSGG